MDVLNQDDIDALLGALDSGEVETEGAPPRIFSRRRLLDLESIEIKKYDFKRPERVSKDQMRALQTLHEAFARNFGAQLSGFLRMIVEVRISSCEQMTYGEFIAGLPNPTSFNLIRPQPLDGEFCLEISPLIIYPIIDRLLGGTNDDLFIPQRAQTAIEMRLITKIIERAIIALVEAWSGVIELDFQIGEMESNPQLVQIVPPNEVVVVICFELKMANRAGTLNLCIPYKVIEPLMDDLSAQSWFNSGQLSQSEETRQNIECRLNQAAVDISAILGETTITLSDLNSLSVGDLIVTETSSSSPAVLCVEGEKKILANLGQFNGARALKVLRPIDSHDRV
ncbi:MAG: flagellar motor switch protein FliM [Phycisphaerales bacterium JB043]